MQKNMVWFFVAMAFGTSAVQATCLSIDDIFFVNNCGVGIDAAFYDQGYCAPTPTKQYPCASYVSAYSRQSIGFTGTVNWSECQSPGGVGHVVAIEQDRQIVCKG